MSIFYSPCVDLRHGAVLLLSNPLSVQQSEIFLKCKSDCGLLVHKIFQVLLIIYSVDVLAVFTEPHNHIWSRTQIPHCL